MSTADALADALKRAIGGNDDNPSVAGFLSTGYPPLDHVISGSYRAGGLPKARMVEIFGPPSSGKTAIATQVMIAAQQAGGFAGFNDHERSFVPELGAGWGLDLSGGKFAYKRPRTFEDSVDLCIKAASAIRKGKFIAPEAPIVWVFDSLAAMIPKSKVDKDAADFNMNDTTALARCTSSAFPALAMHAEELNVLVIFLNQARTKIGVMFGDPTSTPGGNAPEFYCSVRIRLGAAQIVRGKGADKVVMGQRIGAECKKNKVHRPFQKAFWNFMFQDDGTGKFDVTGSLIDYLIEIGKLTATGGKGSPTRVTWPGDGKSYLKSQLAAMIDSTGALSVLMELLPQDGEKVEITSSSEVEEE